MPNPSEFPHLKLKYHGQFTPRFNGGPIENAEVEANLADRSGHASRLGQKLDQWRVDFETARNTRQIEGLPPVPADYGFILRVPEGADGDAIAHELGIELVAETSDGLMFVATKDLSAAKLRDVLRRFASGSGGGQAANILEIFTGPEDNRKLNEVLAPGVRELWPFDDQTLYTFDFAIHSAESTRKVKFPRCRQKKSESPEQFQLRREAERQKVREAADEAWQDNMQARFSEFEQFVRHYNGQIIAGPMNDVEQEVGSGLVFPDSFQVRLKITGAGVKDIVRNLAHLFEVTLPVDGAAIEQSGLSPQTANDFVLEAPDPSAPAVCIIDSGIQEEHKWLSAAIDKEQSKNFLPAEAEDNVADLVRPRGHGTRVAGAVLYPRDIPTAAAVKAVAWLQNAKVLNDQGRLPDSLPPERYLASVVEHFGGGPRQTRIYNHSINSNAPCLSRRMSSWAAKIDELSHQQEVLFIQSAGNIATNQGNMANPGLLSYLQSGVQHPHQLLKPASRIANPAQSLHALTVGSVAHDTWSEEGWKSFANSAGDVASYSRVGLSPPWAAIKPDVVEFGGDLVHSTSSPWLVRYHPNTCIDLLSSTLHGEPAYAKDGAGTSFAAPKVAHIAAHLQAMFPDSSALLFRALIVQSARWPEWAEAHANKNLVVKLIGYGMPSLERAVNNAPNRITLITPGHRTLSGKQYDLFTIPIPEEMRGPAQEARIRVDLTLAYTSEPRRTRARNRSYLETWLDWSSSRYGESLNDFKTRLENGGGSFLSPLPWVIGNRRNEGDVTETNRSLGSVQKDWAIFEGHNLPSEFAIAVRAHPGWNHRPGEGEARYCLVISFEALDGDIPVYQMIENELEAEVLL